MSEGDRCRHKGCLRQRTRFSVFCDEHHQRQLEEADARANALRWQDTLTLWTGPISVNLLRVGVAAAAAILIHDLLNLSLQLLILTALTVPVVWRCSARVVRQPYPRLPIAHIPGLLALFPMTLIAAAIEALAATVVIVLIRALQ